MKHKTRCSPLTFNEMFLIVLMITENISSFVKLRKQIEMRFNEEEIPSRHEKKSERKIDFLLVSNSNKLSDIFNVFISFSQAMLFW